MTDQQEDDAYDFNFNQNQSPQIYAPDDTQQNQNYYPKFDNDGQIDSNQIGNQADQYIKDGSSFPTYDPQKDIYNTGDDNNTPQQTGPTASPDTENDLKFDQP